MRAYAEFPTNSQCFQRRQRVKHSPTDGKYPVIAEIAAKTNKDKLGKVVKRNMETVKLGLSLSLSQAWR